MRKDHPLYICLEYIEQNLRSQITPQELADLCGYSLYHFCRLFQAEVGVTVMRYVQNRRLHAALYAISQGMYMADAAQEFGFDTYAGFYKAFRRQFLCSPSEFLKRYPAAKLRLRSYREEDFYMHDLKKLQMLLSEWGLEQETIQNCYYEWSGECKENTWEVGDRWVLKTGTDLAALTRTLRIAEHLADSGFEASTAVGTKDGGEYLWDGVRYFCLTNQVKGTCALAAEILSGKVRASVIGEAVGRLHPALREMEALLTCKDANVLKTAISWSLPKAKERMGFSDSRYTMLMEGMKRYADQLPVQVIHRDPNPSNLILRDGTVVGFIDFELSERNVRIFDPCYASTAVLCETIKGGADFDAWLAVYRGIRDGYDRVCPLTKEEKEAYPYVVMAIQMMCVAYFGSHERFEPFYHLNLQMTRLLLDRFEQLK